jgi:ectoine hydroxylase-related dioxygenase (phytanoyl-CoA dioxygenase family)
MRVWSGSHKDNLKEHEQKFNEGNLLTRGQTVNNVPKEKTTPLVLEAGQMSLHHPKVVHGSDLNKSDDRRIGFVIQSYIGSNVKQVLGKNSVQIARGKDDFNYHKKIPRTQTLMNKDDLFIKKRENENLQEIFYKGSNKKGTY